MEEAEAMEAEVRTVDICLVWELFIRSEKKTSSMDVLGEKYKVVFA